MPVNSKAVREILSVFGCSSAQTELPEAYQSDDGVIVTPHYTVEKRTACPEGYQDSSMDVKINVGPSMSVYVSAACPNCKKCEAIVRVIPKLDEIKKRYDLPMSRQSFDGKRLGLY